MKIYHASSHIAKAMLAACAAFLLCSAVQAQPLDPIPFIQGISPVSAAPGAVFLTVNGTGFQPGSAVYWNGSPLPNPSVTLTRIAVPVPTQNSAIPGTARITVVSPSGRVSNAVYFSVASPESTILTSRTDRPSGLFPSSQTAADFNGDGVLDLAVTSFGDDMLTVLLGDGSGGFSTKSTYAIGRYPAAILSGDFNRDGIADLAMAISGPDDSVSILIGKGDGTFQPPVAYAAGPGPGAMVAGDFDQNGTLDLAVANSGVNTVSVLLGNGNGTFFLQSTFPTGPGPSSLALGDFNGDGLLDIAVAQQDDNTVAVHHGTNILGRFESSAISYTMASNATGGLFVAAADFNNDGRLDLVVASGHAGSLLILLNDALGGFTSHYTRDSGTSPFGVSVGDFNGDGFLDLLVNGGAVMPGDGTGNFNAAPLYFNAGIQPAFSIFADLDGDGRPDIVIANKYADNSLSSSSLSIFLQSALAFGVVTPGFPSLRPLTVTNAGAATITPTSAVTSGLNAADFVPLLGTCNRPLAPGVSCDFSVTFTPSTSGPESATLFLTDAANVRTSARLTGGTIGASQISMSVSPASALYGTPISLSAVVTAFGGTPTGYVVFSDGGTQLGQGIIDATGRASFTTSTLNAGGHLFTAVYPGGPGFTSAKSVGVSYTIQKQTPGIAWSDQGPITYGTPLSSQQLDAGVSIPGILTYQPGAGAILPVGVQDLFVGFAPTDFVDYNSSSLHVHITVTQAATVTTITGHTPGPSVVGQPVTVSFQVAPQIAGTPTGTVTIQASSGQTCSAPAPAGSCTLVFTAASSPTLQASYSGDTNFLAGTSAAVTHLVSKAATVTTITANTPNPVVSGQPVTVSFKVAPQFVGQPTGVVTVTASTGENCGPVMVASTGSCTLVLNGGGTVILTATYKGDANFNGSVSAGTSQTVSNFSITVSPLNQTISGNTATVAISLKSKAGFQDAVSLTCSPDSKLACALGASSLNLKNNYDTNATLVVDKSIKSGTFHATFTAKSSSGLTQSVTASVTLTGK